MKSITIVLAFYCATAIPADMSYWNATVSDPVIVANTQEALQSEGYDPGTVDGRLKPKTVLAVKQAQQDRELEPTGRLDRRTVAALGIDVERR